MAVPLAPRPLDPARPYCTDHSPAALPPLLTQMAPARSLLALAMLAAVAFSATGEWERTACHPHPPAAARRPVQGRSSPPACTHGDCGAAQSFPALANQGGPAFIDGLYTSAETVDGTSVVYVLDSTFSGAGAEPVLAQSGTYLSWECATDVMPGERERPPLTCPFAFPLKS